MTITLRIPDDAEPALRHAWGEDLDAAALEALVVEGYRSRRFGVAVVRRLLGLGTRWDAEAWLASRGVLQNYSAEDLAADRRTLDRILGNQQ